MYQVSKSSWIYRFWVLCGDLFRSTALLLSAWHKFSRDAHNWRSRPSRRFNVQHWILNAIDSWTASIVIQQKFLGNRHISNSNLFSQLSGYFFIDLFSTSDSQRQDDATTCLSRSTGRTIVDTRLARMTPESLHESLSRSSRLVDSRPRHRLALRQFRWLP